MIEKWTDCITAPRGAWEEIERLRARVAELEAAQKPVRFSEKMPEPHVMFLLCWWDLESQSWHWEPAYYNQFAPHTWRYWLPMPPAPEEA